MMTAPLHPPTERPRPRRMATWIAISVIGLVAMTISMAIGYGVGWFDSYGKSSALIERTLAMGWGDGAYGPAYYGAHVYGVPDDRGWSVRARVIIGGWDGAMSHDCGEIARANTWEQAVADWGRVNWRDDGLHIGTLEGNTYFLPRRRIESHR